MAKQKAQPLSLKKQGEAIEQATKFYTQGNFVKCAESLLVLCSDPVIAPLDVLTRIIHSKNQDYAEDVQKIASRKLANTKSEGSYDEHLMHVLIKEISECPKKDFLSFLGQEKSSNAAEQLQEALGENVFNQLVASLQLPSDTGIKSLGETYEGKEESNEE